MPILEVSGNRVAADEPGPDDTHVQVIWFGPSQDGQHRKIFNGPVEPIENYEDTVAWAVEMAGQMAYPLYVLPLTGIEALRSDQMQGAVANLTDKQRGELRRGIVATLATIMRDCDEPNVRGDAYDLLVGMGVVRP